MLQLNNVSLSFGNRVLFTEINLSLLEGDKVGLVGVNGTGKSSLLRIIMGELEPDGGKISRRNGLRIGYLSQQHHFAEGVRVIDAVFSPHDPTARLVGAWQSAVERGDTATQERLLPDMDRLAAWQYEQEATAILHALRITDVERPMELLSGGEVKRVALAGVLLQKPDLLILDEPTNHLDLEVIEWLEGYLSRTRLTLLLVTHDRYFLDHICTRIVEMDQQKLYSYEGNYEAFLTKRQERIEQMAQTSDRLANIYRQELVWMRATPQARGGKQRARKEHFATLSAELSQARQILREQTTIEPLHSSVRLGKQVIELAGVTKGFEESRVLFRDFDYIFSRRDRVGIVGPNGCGKTTLLKVLMGELQPDSGSVVIGETVQLGYFGQKLPHYAPDKRVIDIVSDIASHITDPVTGQSVSATQLLQRFLFSGDRIYTPVSLLSGGELRRLYLCTVLMSNPNLLILDEPTNDLDITTLGVLEGYLSAFDGVLIIVTHDRYFLDKLVEHLFVFERDGVIRDFPGNFTQYRLQQAAEQETKSTPPPSTSSPRQPSRQSSRKKRRSYREEQEFQQLEQQIPLLEQRLTELEQRMSSGTLSNEELLRAGEKIAQTQQEMETASDRWFELAAIEEEA
ncbi:MAG: ABC-F family ATP-binding cassette domain-containing protein [Porphyromonas sp.]|uniref:ribosomal protection-like ABC-F family protein n=1 Tax=Porphyromonas sp. TaxID=1924944 RepID=UPI001A5972D0|nr:ABC-F family ATP-binding cassette domain-containing protein [Porphyromonas sp.]MBL6453391.1 ABC-F family ATP-binding cassette domain-containing protein [Porphyromonas sp.]